MRPPLPSDGLHDASTSDDSGQTSHTANKRLRYWAKDPLEIPPALSSANLMSEQMVSNLPPCPFTFLLEVGQAEVESHELTEFHNFLLQFMTPLLQGMPPMGRYGSRKNAYWCISLSPMGRNFANLSRELSHSGFYTVEWGLRTVTIPVNTAPPPLPPSFKRLKFLNVPLHCARVGLPEAILDAAGYKTVSPPTSSSEPITPVPGAVVLLRYRLGHQANAAVFIVDVLPPPDDPFLHRLPPFLPQLSTPGRAPFSTFLDKDPLFLAPPAAIQRRRAPLHHPADDPAEVPADIPASMHITPAVRIAVTEADNTATAAVMDLLDMLSRTVAEISGQLPSSVSEPVPAADAAVTAGVSAAISDVIPAADSPVDVIVVDTIAATATVPAEVPTDAPADAVHPSITSLSPDSHPDSIVAVPTAPSTTASIPTVPGSLPPTSSTTASIPTTSSPPSTSRADASHWWRPSSLQENDTEQGPIDNTPLADLSALSSLPAAPASPSPRRQRASTKRATQRNAERQSVLSKRGFLECSPSAWYIVPPSPLVPPPRHSRQRFDCSTEVSGGTVVEPRGGDQ